MTFITLKSKQWRQTIRHGVTWIEFAEHKYRTRISDSLHEQEPINILLWIGISLWLVDDDSKINEFIGAIS